MKRILVAFICLLLFISNFLFSCGDESGKVSVKYFSSAVELNNMLNENKLDAGLVAEPMASKIESMGGYYRLSLQDLYGENSYPQAVIMASENLLFSIPEIASFLENNFSDNISWIKQNTALALQTINAKLDSGVTPSLNSNLINADVIDKCNIYYKKAVDNKNYIENYLSSIIEIDNKSAKQVDSNFYYDGNLSPQSFTKENITFVCPDGAPALAIAKFIYDSESIKGLNVNYKIVSSDKIGSYMLNGSGDIVVCPTNATSKLYNSGNVKYKALSVITHGNLYIMSKEKLELKDLNGKKIGVIGQGLVPDLTFRSILKNNSMEMEIAL
ncbi:MAG: hypothetical protein KBS91_02075 [Firmicutes bacterium]|nr:hypothetical protein [Candidatus Caballimonas caccae]